MKPITQIVHARKSTPNAVCPTCFEPVGKSKGCKSRGPIMKYNNPIMKQSCKY